MSVRRFAVAIAVFATLFVTACSGTEDQPPVTPDDLATLKSRVHESRLVASYEFTGDSRSLQSSTIAKDGDVFLTTLIGADDAEAYAAGRLSAPDGIIACATVTLAAGQKVCLAAEEDAFILGYAPLLGPFVVLDPAFDGDLSLQALWRTGRREVAGLVGDCYRADFGEFCVAADGTILDWSAADGVGLRLTSRDDLTDPSQLRIPYRIVTEAEVEGAR